MGVPAQVLAPNAAAGNLIQQGLMTPDERKCEWLSLPAVNARRNQPLCPKLDQRIYVAMPPGGVRAKERAMTTG
mgnify:CR=1 FL=1